ncbi:hypothetical protein D3C87_1627550 [compost metagenome]
MAGRDDHRNAGQQRDISPLADRMVGRIPARHGDQQVGQQRNTEVAFLEDQEQANEGADQRAHPALGGAAADIAVMLEPANDHEHRDRRPFAMRHVDAGGQRDGHQQGQRHARGVEDAGLAESAIGVEQRACCISQGLEHGGDHLQGGPGRL